MTGDCCMAAMVCSMIGFPAILISCFGILRPTLVPVPPASTTATLRNFVTRVTVQVRAGARHDPIPVLRGSPQENQ